MKKFLVIIIAFILLCGCESKVESVNIEPQKTIENVFKENNYIIVDVRTKEEFESGHVVGAINIPYDEIGISNLEKDKAIIVYCKSGGRSKTAYNTLKNLGYNVYDLGAYDSITLDKE